MSPIGVVICNYNKKKFVLDCIQSVWESKVHNFDIYMVDNASSDGSVEAVKEAYGEKVHILANSENLGGSGGFNTGLRVVLEKGYPYVMLLDDDAQVDENALSVLYEYMEQNPKVGMAGCRVYHRQMPEYIQQSGLTIEFEKCRATTLCADCWENGTLPDVISCDTVATCAVMVRTSAIRDERVGWMPEDNFIYWDDMEWGHRMTLAGYRVVTIGRAAALHQMGANTKKATTFNEYYMWRNRLHFFMRYTPEAKLEEMSVAALGGVFDSMYECMFRDEHHVMQSISHAYYDAINQVRGKATEGKILPNDSNDNKFITAIRGKRTYAIIEDGMAEDAYYFRNFLTQLSENIKETEKMEEADIVFHMCPSVFRVTDFSLNEIYVDAKRNCLLTQEDVKAIQNYAYSRLFYIYANQMPFLEACRRLRKEKERAEKNKDSERREKEKWEEV